MGCLPFLSFLLISLPQRLAFVCPAFCVLEEIELRGEFSAINVWSSLSFNMVRFRRLTITQNGMVIESAEVEHIH